MLSLCLVVLTAAACRQILGVETRSEGDPLVRLGEACGACVEKTCEDAERACAADSACSSLAACVADHPADPAARVACEAASPLAAELTSYASLSACMRGDCQEDCLSLVGLFAGFDPACDPCLVAACSEAVRECIAQPSCERTVVAALADADDLTPPALITINNAPGAEGAQLRAIYECSADPACADHCGFDGRDLGCVADYRWDEPKPALASAQFELTVSRLEVAGSAPVPGAVVRACVPLVVPCDVLDSDPADDAGLVAITIPITPSTGFLGYFTITSEPPAGEFVPIHAFAGRPIFDGARGSAGVVTRSFLDGLATSGAGTSLLPARSQVVVQFLDCRGRVAPDIRLELPDEIFAGPETRLYYPYEGEAPATTGTGQAIIFNAAPGCFEVAGTVRGQENYRVRFEAEPDVISYVIAYPKSDPEVVGYVCNPNGVAR